MLSTGTKTYMVNFFFFFLFFLWIAYMVNLVLLLNKKNMNLSVLNQLVVLLINKKKKKSASSTFQSSCLAWHILLQYAFSSPFSPDHTRK
jgi:hypothetical protein